MVAIGLRPPTIEPRIMLLGSNFHNRRYVTLLGTWFIREYFDPTRAAKALNMPILDLEPW
jgi:hypothetical protein